MGVVFDISKTQCHCKLLLPLLLVELYLGNSYVHFMGGGQTFITFVDRQVEGLEKR